MTGSGPLGRDAMPFREKMARYHGEIERLVYAAEIVCEPERICYEEDCPFHITSREICSLKAMRHYIGDHIDQHDCSAGAGE